MTRRLQGPHYSRVAKFLHWLIALAIFGQLFLGFYMKSVERGSTTQFELFQLHKSVGITILLLTVIRVIWRIWHKPPPLPETLARWERVLAKASHHLVYVVLLAIPLTGWALVSSSPLNMPTVLFGSIPWPDLPGLQGFADQRAVSGAFSEAHELLALAMIGLLVLHVAAALRHHFILKDDVLIRMLPFTRKEGQ